MASIRKLARGYGIRVSYKDAQGKYHTVSKSGFATKREAALGAAELERKYDRGADISDQAIGLVEYYDRWVELYRSGKRSASTNRKYAMIHSALIDHFAGTPLNRITPSAWQAFLNDYSVGHKRATVRMVNSIVSSVVRAAINDQLIFSNFTFGATFGGGQSKEAADKFLEVDQLEALMKVTYARSDFAHITSCMIYLAAVTGARFGEILGLTWADIDFDKCMISITKTWDYHFHTGFQATKTPSSVRTVATTRKAMVMLRHLQQQQAAFYLKSGARDPQNMVFRTKHGELPGNTAVNRVLGEIQKWADQAMRAENPASTGIPRRITFHGLRHSHVSYLISKGVDIYYISQRLGHKNISITLQVYSHLLKRTELEQEKRAVEALESLEN